MNHIAVKSSFIKSIAYDPTAKTLEVAFKAGRIYQYLDVPPEVYDGMISTQALGESIGKLFSKISGVFAHIRVDEKEGAPADGVL